MFDTPIAHTSGRQDKQWRSNKVQFSSLFFCTSLFRMFIVLKERRIRTVKERSRR